MRKLGGFFKSFSFRTGILIFAAFFSVQVAIRVTFYNHSIASAREDIHRIIMAHVDELERSAKQYGTTQLLQLVTERIGNLYDKNLFLALEEKDRITGNIEEIPDDLGNGPWADVTLAHADAPSQHVLAHVSVFGDTRMIVGYDLESMDALHSVLVSGMLQSLLSSLAGALFLSIAIIWLLNHSLYNINMGFVRVMQGNLSYRIRASGGHDQFDKLANHFNAMLDWVEALVGTVKYSTTSIAHDMRTPLSRHRLRLQALLSDPTLPEHTREDLREATEEVDALAEMFDNILNIANAEGRSGVEHFTQFDAVALVRDVLEFYEPLISEKNIILTASLPEKAADFTGDRQLLTQAVANLLDNAVKYSQENGKIAVESEVVKGWLYIRIRDNGPGVPADHLEKVKERFFRLDTSRNTPGSGLGLSLVEAAAKLHRGRLTLSNQHPGLCATLALPLKH